MRSLSTEKNLILHPLKNVKKGDGMQFRKIAAVAGSVLMAGATLATAGLAAKITSVGQITTEMGKSGENFPLFVVGADAKPADVVGAIDIAVRLAANYKTTEPVTVEGVGTQVSVSGGKMLQSENEKLYLKSYTNDAVDALDVQDLENLLQSGKLKVGSDEYTYDQYLKIGKHQIKYGKPGNEDDPSYYIDLGDNDPTVDTDTDYVVQAEIVFSDAVNMTDADGKEITILGKTFTIAPETSSNELVLYSSAQEVQLGIGEEATVTVGDDTYTIKVLGKKSDDTAIISVNGVVKDAKEGEEVEDYDNLYVKDVTFYTTGGDTLYGSVTIMAGSEKVTLKNGERIKVGDDYVDGTKVSMDMNNGELSYIKIALSPEDNDKDYLKAGDTWTAPVFDKVKLKFNGLDGAEKEEIKVEPSSTSEFKVSFKDKRGNDISMVFADYDGSNFELTDGSHKAIHVVEGEKIDEGEYAILSAVEGRERLVKVSDIDTSNHKIELEDVATGDKIEVNLQGPTYTNATKYIDAKTYYFNVTGDGKVQITWGSGAGYGNPGNEVTVYPVITTSKGAKVAFLEQVLVPNNTNILLPGDDNTYSVSCSATAQKISTAVNVNYTYVDSSTSGYCKLNISEPITTDKPAILVVEEENKAQNDNKYAVVMSVKYDSGNDDRAEIDQVKMSDPLAEQGVSTSDNYLTEYVDTYGVEVKKNTEDQGYAKLYYPDTQLVAAVAVGENPEFTQGGAGTVETEKVLKVENDIAKLDVEVANDDGSIKAEYQNYDLIVVGGPAVNRVAAWLMGKTYPSYGADSGIPENAALVKVFPDVPSEGHTAVLVAGWTAEDTKKAALRVQQGNFGDYANEPEVIVQDSTVIVPSTQPAEEEQTQTEEQTEGEAGSE